jgi:hypothetical protein
VLHAYLTDFQVTRWKNGKRFLVWLILILLFLVLVGCDLEGGPVAAVIRSLIALLFAA